MRSASNSHSIRRFTGTLGRGLPLALALSLTLGPGSGVEARAGALDAPRPRQAAASEATSKRVDPRPAAAFLPRDCALLLELAQPAELVRRLRARPLGIPVGYGRPAPEWRQSIEQLEQFLGSDLENTLDLLASRGVALGLEPEGQQWAACLVLSAKDAPSSERCFQELLAKAAKTVGATALFKSPHETLFGAPVWSFGDGLWLSHLDGLSFACTQRNSLLEVLKRSQQSEDLGPLLRAELLEARALPAPPIGAWLWLDLERLRRAQTEIDWPGLDRLTRRPEGLISLGAMLASTPKAKHWTVRLAFEPNSVGFDLNAQGIQGIASELMPDAPCPRLGLPESEGNLISALLYRDLGKLAADRGALLESDALGAFSAKLAELETLFGGLRLGEDVLPKLSPWWQLAVREVPFKAGEAPGFPLPGALLCIGLPADPALAHSLEAAFQSLVTLTNLDGAQSGRAPLRLAAKLHGGISYSVATPLPLAEGEIGDVRYNLAPALAVTSNLLLIASHEALLLDGLDRIEAPGHPAAETQETIQVRGQPLAAWAKTQWDALSLFAALKGLEPKELVPWLDWVHGLEATTAVSRKADRVRWTVRLEQAP